MSRHNFFLAALVAVFAFGLDRVLKYFFVHHSAVSYGGDFFISFRLAMNPGIAFGISLVPFFILVGTAIAIIMLMWWLVTEYNQHHYVTAISIFTIIAGACSNMYDRLRFGFVIDYIDVRWFTILNIADIMITCGATSLILMVWYQERKEKIEG